MNDLEFNQELEENGDFMTMNHKKEFCHFQVKSRQFLIIWRGQLAMHASSVYSLLPWDKLLQNMANTNTFYLTLFLRVRNPGVALLVVLAQGHSWSDQSCSHLVTPLGWGLGGVLSRWLIPVALLGWRLVSCHTVFSIRPLECLHSMAASFLKDSDLRGWGGGHNAFNDPFSEFAHGCFCHILFVRTRVQLTLNGKEISIHLPKIVAKIVHVF